MVWRHRDRGRGWSGGLLLVLFLTVVGCGVWSGQPGFAPGDWVEFENDRYGFILVYPSAWQVQPLPTNGDGLTVLDPDSAGAIGVTSWATQIPAAPEFDPADPLEPRATILQNQISNLVTTQGIPAQLAIEIELDQSRMSLTLRQGQIEYHWIAQAPSDRFAQYYELFDGLMRRFTVTAPLP